MPKRPARAGSLLVQEDFSPDAEALRGAFDARFADPRRTEAGRFVWDFWHVPDQYTVLRTPAWEYFPPRLWRRLDAQLRAFGRERLGCAALSPVWLSCYVDGCGQELHADVPHGPWAFVLSLTRWKTRRFTGGETLLLKPATLDYWRAFPSMRGIEQQDLVEKVPAEFNRLVVFDPRIPHGVTRVNGTMDPREGRLVLHGWFTEPQPIIEGALRPASVSPRIATALEALGPVLEAHPEVHGTLALRIDVDADGTATSVHVLADTLVSLAQEENRLPALVRSIRAAFRRVGFPKAKGPTRITLPLLFRTEG